MAGHDIIVIGASSGGVESLPQLMAQLSENLPAALFVVQHTSPRSKGFLARILDRAGPLTAKMAEDNDPINQGHVYVAPPDHHLLVKGGHIRLSRGPKENRTRPAIDPLFRSAAAAYGARVMGVLLTGLRDDGVAGLVTIKRCGGIVIVQDPNDALYPEMPMRALETVEVDHRLPLTEIGAVLDRLSREPVREFPPIPPDVLLEARLAENIMSNVRNEELGDLAPLSCPDCGGPLWQLHDKQMRRYRCRVGHGFTAQNLLADQNQAIEYSLWAALRAIQERASVLEGIASDELARGKQELADAYQKLAEESRLHAQQLLSLLQGGA